MDGSNRGSGALGRKENSSGPEVCTRKRFPGVRVLQESQVIEILRRRAKYKNKRLKADHPDSLQSLAAEFNVTQTTIGVLSRGESYRDIYRKFNRD
jgi:hypothetical protein